MAIGWLAYRTLRYDEPGDAWEMRGTPLAATYGHRRATARRLGVVARRCDGAVEEGGCAAEAPRTIDEVNVQVSTTLRTSCAGPDPRSGQAAPDDEPLAATLVVDRGTDGLWRVSARLF